MLFISFYLNIQHTANTITENAIFGGGWFAVDGSSKLVTGPTPIPGFSLTSISGDGGFSTNWVWRYWKRKEGLQ